MSSWKFYPEGPDTSNVQGPALLLREGMSLPTEPGLYFITCGDCLAHIGTSRNIKKRVGQLAALGTHRGSAEVLCTTYCIKQEPWVWWEVLGSDKLARQREKEFKKHPSYGEPPLPQSKYGKSCKNGQKLKEELVKVAGQDSWEAGFIETVFAIGEMLSLLFDGRKFSRKFGKHRYRRIEEIWQQVGKPPGPWQKY